MKKFIVALVFCLILVLVSCGESKLDSYTTIDNKGNATLKLKLSYDSIVKAAVGNDILNSLFNNSLKINSYYDQENQLYVEETTLSHDEINKILDKEMVAKYINVKTEKKSGFLYKTRELFITFNGPLSDVVGEEKANFLSDIPFVNVINVNGKVINSNAQNQINDETVQWSMMLSQITKDTQFYLKYQNINYVSIFISIVVIAIVIYLLMIKVRKRKILS